jgi:hypothetical protein
VETHRLVVNVNKCGHKILQGLAILGGVIILIFILFPADIVIGSADRKRGEFVKEVFGVFVVCVKSEKASTL